MGVDETYVKVKGRWMYETPGMARITRFAPAPLAGSVLARTVLR